MNSATHGNPTTLPPSGGISPIALEKSSAMTWTLPADPSSDLPPRPLLVLQQSSSLPSTPYHHPRNFSFHSRTPSPRRRSTSPHSTQSETNHLPSSQKPPGGCRYETGMAFFRRRMPYSLGGDLLPEEKDELKERLNPDEGRKLSGDMRELYDRLLPSPESEERRRQLVKKLEKLFNSQWPGSDIKVHVFGSSGNKLCSSDSDVDICITTPVKELQHVCLLAEALANHGMERVICVSHAKVPIVKIWDPDLQLACDMNVNNTLALENTRMIRTYVDIDERVRPLAMIVKYWTRRRILNDAALGGTLSSYAWICLIINFLQTREPPILPSLQARPYKPRTTADGMPSSFDDDLDSLVGFGRKNKQSLGELLFDFFRYYGYEVNYEKYVVSIREGKLISKERKGWHLLQNNRLGVEEPFNTSRNLGNTADDTSFRGVHMELRRAFKAVAEANFGKCCEQYEFPAEEERSWEKPPPPPQPRPIIAPTPSHPSRGGRGGGRGARHSNYRGGNTGRRPSSANKPNNLRHSNVASSHPEVSLQAQAQYLLHEHLFQQIQILQAQEQELRMQLHNPTLLNSRPPPLLVRQPFVQLPFSQQDVNPDESPRARAHPPLTAPIRQQVFYPPNYLPMTVSGVQGSNTNPPSPSTAAAVPDFRRNHRRSSVANGSPGGSLRSHSQPARSLHSPAVHNFASIHSSAPPPADTSSQNSKQRLTPGSPGGAQSESDTPYTSGSQPSFPRSPFIDENRQSEYLGYYLGGSPQLQAYHPPIMVPSPNGLAIQNGGIPAFNPHVHEYRSPVLPFTDSLSLPSDHGPVVSRSVPSPPRVPRRTPSGPLIIDGSVPPAEQRNSMQGDRPDQFSGMSSNNSISDGHSYDTSASTSDALSMDLQDPVSGEIDHQNYPQRNPETRSNANTSTNDKLVNGQQGRLGPLSRRLHNLHLSTLDRSEESTPKAERERTKANHPSGEVPDQDVSDLRLSAACERPTPTYGLPSSLDSPTASPTIRRRPNGLEPERPNGVSPKGKLKVGHDNYVIASPTSLERKERQLESLPRKPDTLHSPSGGRDPAVTNTGGGWQTTKKKHKRNPKSSVETRHINGVEPLPADESMRKGG
ncbi:hypothetical protein V8E54_014831 [Elaphomyces granulatus]